MIARPPEAMVAVAGGRFRMGSDRHYPEEAPAREVEVGTFAIDAAPVTNAQFARFVAATGHVTLAETPSDGAPDGALVFRRTSGPAPLDRPELWWAFVEGACWRRPLGPASSVEGLDDHPVVQVAFTDAAAYAAWAGRALPSEAQWEFAARGGLEGAEYAWGDCLFPNGRAMANIWLGRFPWERHGPQGAVLTTPVGTYPANGYGLYDMIGNVWEWTADAFDTRGGANRPCCAPPTVAAGRGLADRVLKGGSHLCAASYCQRYRPAARWAQAPGSPTSHIGFRCVGPLRAGLRPAA